jgi:hypothetical protein
MGPKPGKALPVATVVPKVSTGAPPPTGPTVAELAAAGRERIHAEVAARDAVIRERAEAAKRAHAAGGEL